jgi:hypothetical protein
VDFFEEVQVSLYRGRELSADVILYDEEVPLVVIEAEGRPGEIEQGFQEARAKAVMIKPEDPVPYIWVAAGARDRLYKANPTAHGIGVAYEALDQGPEELLAFERLSRDLSDYLKRRSSAEQVGQIGFRVLFEQAYKSLSRQDNPHTRCRKLLKWLAYAALGTNRPRGRRPRALSNLIEQASNIVTSSNLSARANFAFAFRHFMRRYFKPLTSDRNDPVRRFGRWLTPLGVIKFLVEAADPQSGERILDFACGSGGFLGQATRHLLERYNTAPDEMSKNLYGCDWDETCTEATKTFLTFMLPERQNQLNIDRADGLRHFEDNIEKFDVTLSNPPAGNLPQDFAGLEDIEGYQFAGRGRGRQALYEVAFLERALQMVREGGRIGLIIPEGLLANATLKRLRDWWFDQVTVEAIVGLPRGTFPFTPSKMCAIVMRKESPPSDYETLLAEVSERHRLSEELTGILNRLRQSRSLGRRLRSRGEASE